MRIRLLIPMAVLLCLSFVPALAIQLGDSRSAVIEEMGQPTGEIGAGAVTVLFYPRGEIQLRDGKVSAIELVSEEELAARQAALADELARLDAARAERNARLEAEGLKELEARRNDPAFAQKSAREQLAYWRTFAARYPMISIAEEIATLRERFEREQRLYELELANEQRMAELEQRVAAAEERAERAERSVRYRAPYFPRHARFPRFPGFRPEPEPATPPNNEARAQAMADYEAARREAFATADGRSPQPE